MNPVDRYDSPLDYKQCWTRLRAAIREAAAGQAGNAATALEEIKVRRAQGAFQFCNQILAIMDNIVEEERGGKVLRTDDDVIQ